MYCHLYLTPKTLTDTLSQDVGLQTGRLSSSSHHSLPVLADFVFDVAKKGSRQQVDDDAHDRLRYKMKRPIEPDVSLSAISL